MRPSMDAEPTILRLDADQESRTLEFLADLSGNYEEKALLGSIDSHFQSEGYLDGRDDEYRDMLLGLFRNVRESYRGEGPIPVLQNFVEATGLSDVVSVDDNGEVSFLDEEYYYEALVDSEDREDLSEEPGTRTDEEDSYPVDVERQSEIDILAGGRLQSGPRWTPSGRRHQKLERAAEDIKEGYVEKKANKVAAQVAAIRLLGVHGMSMPWFGPISRKDSKRLAQQDEDNGLVLGKHIIDDVHKKYNGYITEDQIYEEYERFGRRAKMRVGAFALIVVSACGFGAGSMELFDSTRPHASAVSAEGTTTTSEEQQDNMELAQTDQQVREADIEPEEAKAMPATTVTSTTLSPRTTEATTTTQAPTTTTTSTTTTTQPKRPVPNTKPKATYLIDMAAYNGSWSSTLIRPGDNAQDIIERLDEKTHDGHSWATIKATNADLTKTNTLIRDNSVSVRNCPDDGEIIQTGTTTAEFLKEHGLTFDELNRLNGNKLIKGFWPGGFCLRTEAPQRMNQ